MGPALGPGLRAPAGRTVGLDPRRQSAVAHGRGLRRLRGVHPARHRRGRPPRDAPGRLPRRRRPARRLHRSHRVPGGRHGDRPARARDRGHRDPAPQHHRARVLPRLLLPRGADRIGEVYAKDVEAFGYDF
ncbi:hypothetical protein LP418_26005 [Nocardioides sp. B-3]|nr:hypothetical protein [Nocardioides sp. B-3]UUZ59277.1 hypothetical protein LP418_26005 [Nocardioides sp. B-3]